MQESKPNLFLRDDTMFGVCEALGEDLRFNPLFLRVALAAMLLWNPVLAIGGYLAAGVLIFFSRMVVRSRKPAAVGAPVEAQPEAPRADNETIAETLAAAA
jgi:hypothetical protein